MIYQHNGMISGQQWVCPWGIFKGIEGCYRYNEWRGKQDSEL